MTRSGLQKCELNYNSGPQFVSAIQIQPGKINCPGCDTFMCEPVLTSIADLQFVLIEFSSELMQGRSQDFSKGGGGGGHTVSK